MHTRPPLVAFSLLLAYRLSGCALLEGDTNEEWDITIALSGTFENDHTIVFLNEEPIFADSLRSRPSLQSEINNVPNTWIEKKISVTGQHLRVTINGETAGTYTFNAHSKRFIWCSYDHTTRLMSFVSYDEPFTIGG